MEKLSFARDYITDDELSNFWTYETLTGVSFSCGVCTTEGHSNILQLDEGDNHAAIIAGDDTGSVLDSVLTSAMCRHKPNLLTVDFIVTSDKLQQIEKYNVKGMHTGRTFIVDSDEDAVVAIKQLGIDVEKRMFLINKFGAFNLHGARAALMEKFHECINITCTWDEMIAAHTTEQMQTGDSTYFSADWSRHLVVIYPFTTLFPACNEKAFARLQMLVRLGRAPGYHFLFVADDTQSGKISIDDRLACMPFASLKIFGDVSKDTFERITECSYIDELKEGNVLAVFEPGTLARMYSSYDYDLSNLNHLLWRIRKTYKGVL